VPSGALLLMLLLILIKNAPDRKQHYLYHSNTARHNVAADLIAIASFAAKPSSTNLSAIIDFI
jgi:hypothetical protein